MLLPCSIMAAIKYVSLFSSNVPPFNSSTLQVILTFIFCLSQVTIKATPLYIPPLQKKPNLFTLSRLTEKKTLKIEEVTNILVPQQKMLAALFFPFLLVRWPFCSSFFMLYTFIWHRVVLLQK